MGILVGLIIILALAPLPFGSATVFWQSVLAASSLVLAAAAIITERRAVAWPPNGQRAIGWAAGLFGLTLIWSVFQGLVPGFGAHPAWTQVEQTLGGPVAGTISLDPFASLSDAVSLAGIGAIFLVSLLVAQNARHARLLINAIAITVAAYAVYGIVVYVSGNSSVAWADKRHYLESLTSTFVNRNSFGVFAGLGALCATAIFANSISSITGSDLSSRDRFRLLIEGMASRMWIWVVVALACIMALFLTGSRAATAATALSLLFFIVIYLSARKAGARTTTIIILAGFVGALVLLNLSGEFLLFRLDDKFSDGLGSRADIYANALVTLRDHLWLGAGYGAFGDAYAIYGSGDGAFSKRVEFAHNVYIEMAIELGLPMAIAFFTSVGLVIFVCIRGIITRRRDRLYAILAVAATILVGVQGIVDFGIQTPAIATLYASLLGIGVAQSVSSRSTSRR